jgi:hypothetical protein
MPRHRSIFAHISRWFSSVLSVSDFFWSILFALTYIYTWSLLKVSWVSDRQALDLRIQLCKSLIASNNHSLLIFFYLGSFWWDELSILWSQWGDSVSLIRLSGLIRQTHMKHSDLSWFLCVVRVDPVYVSRWFDRVQHVTQVDDLTCSLWSSLYTAYLLVSLWSKSGLGCNIRPLSS